MNTLDHRDKKRAILAAAFPQGIRCQKCLQHGHWSYQCTNKRKILVAPSRTKIFKNKIMNIEKRISGDCSNGQCKPKKKCSGSSCKLVSKKCSGSSCKLTPKKCSGGSCNMSDSSSSSDSSDNSDSSDSSDSSSSSESDSDSDSESDSDSGSESDSPCSRR